MIVYDSELRERAGELVDVVLTTADPTVREANSIDDLTAFLEDSDISRLVVPANATVVTLRVLDEQALIRSKSDPPKLAAVIHDEITRRVRELDEDRELALEPLRLALEDLQAADFPDAKAVRAAQRALEDAAEPFARQRARVEDDHVREDPEARQALKDLRVWERASRRELVAAAVHGVRPDDELVELLGARVREPWTPKLANEWLDLIPPLARLKVINDLYVHASRCAQLGKAPPRRFESPPGSPTSPPTDDGPAATAPPPAAELEATAEGPSPGS